MPWWKFWEKPKEPVAPAAPPPDNPYEPQVRPGVDDDAAEMRGEAIRKDFERREQDRPSGGGTEPV